MPASALLPENPTEVQACVETQDKTQPAPSNQMEHIHPTPRIRPKNQGNQQINKHPKKARLRANIRIASQNVNGAAAPSEHMNYKEKWKSISQTIHAEKIAVLAI